MILEALRKVGKHLNRINELRDEIQFQISPALLTEQTALFSFPEIGRTTKRSLYIQTEGNVSSYCLMIKPVMRNFSLHFQYYSVQ
jgi:hypothetical protein